MSDEDTGDEDEEDDEDDDIKANPVRQTDGLINMRIDRQTDKRTYRYMDGHRDRLAMLSCNIQASFEISEW